MVKCGWNQVDIWRSLEEMRCFHGWTESIGCVVPSIFEGKSPKGPKVSQGSHGSHGPLDCSAQVMPGNWWYCAYDPSRPDDSYQLWCEHQHARLLHLAVPSLFWVFETIPGHFYPALTFSIFFPYLIAMSMHIPSWCHDARDSWWFLTSEKSSKWGACVWTPPSALWSWWSSCGIA